MREVERIPKVLKALGELWAMVPDWRFGQLVMNLSRDDAGEFEDPWSWEEEEWIYRIGKLKREIEVGMTFS